MRKCQLLLGFYRHREVARGLQLPWQQDGVPDREEPLVCRVPWRQRPCVLQRARRLALHSVRPPDARYALAVHGRIPGGGVQEVWTPPPPFVPRCRLFNIGPKIGPPSGPPFLLVDLIWTPLSKILDPHLLYQGRTQDFRRGGWVPRSAKQANNPNKRATDLTPRPGTHQGSMFRPY